MKNNQIAVVLAGLMFIMSAGTVCLLIRYNISAKELRDVSLNVNLAKNTDNVLRQLVYSVNEYSKKDPGILPLLQWATNGTPNLPLPPLPSAKPSAK